GVEQTWRFDARPAGDRVALGVTLAGLSLEGAGDEGLRLRAPGGAMLRYSHATWVGADGARTAVPARWDGGRVVLEVPAAVVARTAFPAVLDPTVSMSFALSEGQPDGLTEFAIPTVTPEVVQVGAATLLFHKTPVYRTGTGLLDVRLVDANGVYVPGTFRGLPATAPMFYTPGERAAWAASYGTGALVVAPAHAGLVALRVAPDGRPIDAAPIPIHTNPTVQTPPLVGGVACLGATCLVVYSLTDRVVARRVGTDGRLLDAAPVVLGTTPGTFGRQAVVAAGGRFVVAWSTTLPGATSDIRVGRVTTAGAALDPEGRPITTAGAARSNLEVATEGTRVFLKWYATASGARPTAVYTQLFDADLTALTSLGVHADLQAGSSAWWDGSEYLVTSHQRLARFDAAGARVDPTFRTVLSSNATFWIGALAGGFIMYEPEGIWRFNNLGVRVSGPHPFARGHLDASTPAADFEGGRFLAGWLANAGVSMVRLDAAGTRYDAPNVRFSFSQFDSGLLMLGLNGTTAEVFQGRQRVSLDLPTRTAGPVTTVFPAPTALVRGGAQRVAIAGGCARRLGANWQPLDPEPVCFAPANNLTGAFDGTSFRFVYTVPPATYTRRMNQDGDLVEFAPLALPALGNVGPAARLAFGAGTHLLVWQANPPAGGVGPITAARIALDGTAGAPFTVAPANLVVATQPALVFDGVNFVVAWSGGAGALHAKRVSPAGAVLDAAPYVFNDNQGPPPVMGGLAFAMASDQRGSTLLVYNALDLEVAGDRIRGAFLREDGVVVPDAGVVPLDVSAAVDVGVAPVDVPAVVDAGAAMDVPRDAPVAVDAGAVDVPV
ncbi:MAG: Flagellar hook-length control protein FliK, partial [Myxococcaceae bacterium]|nr:Flagellar hook-length control protein FliK [Myxococcaceae bacterium]